MALHTYYNGKNSQHLQHQILESLQSNKNTHLLLVGMQNCTVILEKFGSF